MAQQTAPDDVKSIRDLSPVATLLRQATEAAAIIVSPQSRGLKTVDAVHDLRVALRRLNGAAVAFEGRLPSSVGHKLRRRTKKLRRLAGKLRDTDILIANLKHLRTQSPDHSEAIDLLIRALKRRRPGLVHKLRCTLLRPKSKNLGAWIRRKVLPDLDPTNLSDSDLMTLALGQIRDRQVEYQSAKIVAVDHDTNHLHAFRIRAKQLRYMIELFACYGIRTSNYYMRDEAELWQDKLGYLQDLLVLRDQCKAMSLESKWSKRDRKSLGKLVRLVSEKHAEACGALNINGELRNSQSLNALTSSAGI